MKKKLLYITKNPEFDENDEVVLGQCEFHTENWELRLFNGGDSKVLATGTFYFVERIMEQLRGIDDLEETVEKARELAEEPPGAIGSTEETQKVEVVGPLGGLPDPQKIREALERYRAGNGEEPLDANLPVSIEFRDDVVIGRVKDTYLVSDVTILVKLLDILQQEQRRIIILDLSEVKNISSRAIHELIRFHEKVQELGGKFFLAGLRRTVQHILNLMNLDSIIEFFPSVEEALSVAAKSG